ncbi:TolC family protein [Sphingobacterium sp. LRF_L2]|uniref:TolC family protein n=1 Tax=Sphingobacterium sp. LRF_L2 TaxID=3369421 RepID=UPI003F62A1D9
MKNKLSLGLLTLSMIIYHYYGIAQSVVDPNVKEFIHKAFQTNKGLKLKSYEVDKAVLEVEGVKSKKLPHVSATGLYGYVHANGSLDIPTINLPILNTGIFEGATDFRMNTQVAYAGVSVRQIIFTGLQIPNGEKALKAKAKAQNYLVEACKEELAKDIVATFDQLMLLTEVNKLIIDSEKRLKKEQEKVNQAIANGMAIPYDRDKLKLALLELEEKKVELSGNKELLIKKIEQETGLSVSEIGGVFYPLLPIYFSFLPEDVLQRSELKALQASSEAYKYLYKKEKGALWPSIFAFGAANYLNVFQTNLRVKDYPIVGDINLSGNYLKGSPNFMVGLGAKWEIFNGGQHKNNLKQVELDQIINATKQADVEEKFTLLLDKIKVSYNTTNLKLKVGNQQVKVASNNLQMASRQHDAGLIDVTELLAAENEWYKVSLNYFSHVLQQRSAVYELLHASGKLLQTINE